MPICIECGYKLANLYTTYSKADDRSLGKGVRLAQCPRCKRFADKYVEHDFVVLFIDLVLIKPQVCGTAFLMSISCFHGFYDWFEMENVLYGNVEFVVPNLSLFMASICSVSSCF